MVCFMRCVFVLAIVSVLLTLIPMLLSESTKSVDGNASAIKMRMK